MAKAVGWFIARSAVLFAVLLLLWLTVDPWYQGVVISVSNAGLRALNVGSATELRPFEQGSRRYIGVYNALHRGMREYLFAFSLESIQTHVPLFLSLVIASPIALKKKLRAAAGGAVLVTLAESAFVLVTLYWSYYYLPENRPFSPFHPSAAALAVADFVNSSYRLVGVHVLPVLAWAVFCWRKEDIARLARRREGDPLNRERP